MFRKTKKIQVNFNIFNKFIAYHEEPNQFKLDLSKVPENFPETERRNTKFTEEKSSVTPLNSKNPSIQKPEPQHIPSKPQEYMILFIFSDFYNLLTERSRKRHPESKDFEPKRKAILHSTKAANINLSLFDR